MYLSSTYDYISAIEYVLTSHQYHHLITPYIWVRINRWNFRETHQNFQHSILNFIDSFHCLKSEDDLLV